MLDDIDRALVHALHLDGRVPFSRVGAVLGVSPQTIARRYQRLRAESSLRVVGLPRLEVTGGAQWMLRLVASPASAQNLAHALVRRPDTSWVYLTSGGTEIVALAQADADATDHALLLRDIPRRSGITQVSAHLLLRTYRGGPSVWQGMADALSPDQQEQLRGPRSPSEAVDVPLEETDRRLLSALALDGRATHTELGAAAGCSAVTAARRLAELRDRGVVYFDVEFETSQLGAPTKALLWMSVPPARLAQVASALAEHRELAFVAVTTGRTNLVANALCDGPAELHDYLTVRLGELDAIQVIESAPVLRTLKASSPVARMGAAGQSG